MWGYKFVVEGSWSVIWREYSIVLLLFILNDMALLLNEAASTYINHTLVKLFEKALVGSLDKLDFLFETTNHKVFLCDNLVLLLCFNLY